MVRLLLIGLAAGVFSSLFGVGGGLLVVPLLLLVARFEPRAAAATSLGAILITAVAGVVLYAVRGHVDIAHAALVGVPATVGALGGVAIQQRLTTRVLLLAFAALLISLGAWLLVG